MVFPWVLCCLLLISNTLWVLKILLMKKDLKGLAAEFRDYLERETNSPLTIPTRDRHIRKRTLTERIGGKIEAVYTDGKLTISLRLQGENQ